MMKEDIAHLLNPPRKEKLHESIVTQVKNLIHSKKLGVGDRLPPERELAKVFQVSRVVIRESLRSLEQSGLIEIRPGPAGGPFVAYNLHKPIFDAAHDLLNQGKLSLPYFLEARRTIECVTVKRAAEKAGPGDLERLEQINARLLEDIGDPAKLREHNTAFHVAIAEIAGNPLLKLMVQSLLDLLGVVFPHAGQSKEFMRHTYERHVAILDAMARRDITRCEELMALDAGHTANLEVDPLVPRPEE
jgi:GntR family transcriptional repressor for pyruvate dehydrogenase complex